MEQNPVRLELATSRAFAGMKRILFQPFDIGKWFALGFSAWLAGLLDGGGSGGGGGNYEEPDPDGSETAGPPTIESGDERLPMVSEAPPAINL